ncbi:MAG: hypothetical protein Q7S95_00105 [bacterium]|nr:hypothetical protein [bacterium]
MDEKITFSAEEPENPSILYGRFAASAQVPAMVRWVLAAGLAKNEAAAKTVLLAITVIAILLAVGLPFLIL